MSVKVKAHGCTHGVSASCVELRCLSRRRSRRCHTTGSREHSAWYMRCDDGATRLGAVPRSSAGADISRGAGRWSCQMGIWARRFISPRAPVTDGPPGLPRVVARRVGRETAVGPPDASSIATARVSRNPVKLGANFVPNRTRGTRNEDAARFAIPSAGPPTHRRDAISSCLVPRSHHCPGSVIPPPAVAPAPRSAPPTPAGRRRAAPSRAVAPRRAAL
jgi:hypothetical protein